jgi:regulator of sirC expression with transglutaminase-like and TPR domain
VSSEKSIQSLVRLIDDPDDAIFEHVRDELLSIGLEAIPFLEHSWEAEDLGLLFQSRIENLIHEIQFNAVKKELKEWIESPHKDLLTGALIVARYQYPNLDEQAVHQKIQQIRRDIWLEISDKHTAYEKVRVFNKIFYGKYNFTGNTKDYHSPLNSFVNTVIETRKGNPLSLCLLYSVIALSLDLPIYGVNLPNHFVLTYLDEHNIHAMTGAKNEYGNLFYINAFSRGGIFDDNEIKQFLSSLNKPFHRNYFEPCSNSAIISRMLTNLITSFQQAGSSDKVNELIELRELFDLNL